MLAGTAGQRTIASATGVRRSTSASVSARGEFRSTSAWQSAEARVQVTISGRMAEVFPESSYMIISPVSGPRVKPATHPPIPARA